MSSGTSSKAEAKAAGAAASGDSGLRPWHVFVLCSLAAATAGVLLTDEPDPANLVFLTATIGAGALAGIGAYRALWPLVAPDAADRTEVLGGRTRAAIEREKVLLLRAIKELEFDRAMKKVSDADFRDMDARLRARAMSLIKQLDSGSSGYRELIELELKRRLGQAAGQVRERAAAPEPAVPERTATDERGTCASCGTSNDGDARFCKNCGTRLRG